ncbi:MAG: hypothetical protein HWQ38_03235 [Nostoc sp. NMS7]|uniref:hypothetical protein n=1 Tax=Nostoc sp. NMS7 TaxID=2815391 RepID=UPI0025D954CE|nr:hypothetical protein [Nostoc sp. NMS7]MBN3945546.1 hypothetical protein [Nostoc sp. NMS7]
MLYQKKTQQKKPDFKRCIVVFKNLRVLVVAVAIAVDTNVILFTSSLAILPYNRIITV